jgi:DNA-binding MarR family transcriptional regulator
MGQRLDSPYLEEWVRMIDHRLTTECNRLLKPYGLTRASWYVLRSVYESGKMSQRRLQEVLGIESGSMAIIVDGLFRKGWLDRIPSETDRRANFLRLTPRGASRWKAVPDIESIFRRKLMREITTEEEADAVNILKKSWKNLTRTSSHEMGA